MNENEEQLHGPSKTLAIVWSSQNSGNTYVVEI